MYIYINIYVYVPRHIKKKCEDKALLESGARDLCASFRHYWWVNSISRCKLAVFTSLRKERKEKKRKEKKKTIVTTA